MPIVDLPLSELRTYGGISPCPEDFDSFWDRSLALLHSVPPDPAVSEVACPVAYARCFELRFKSVGGAIIRAQVVCPKEQAAPAPAVLRFHGYRMNAGDWSDGYSFAASGAVSAAMDVRGQGGGSEDVGGDAGPSVYGHIIRGLEGSPEGLLYRSVFLDTAQLARALIELGWVDPARMAAVGASQGGALALACAALEPRIRRVVSWYPFLSDYRRVWEMDLAKDAYAELRDYFRRFDPRHLKVEQAFERLGYIDVQHLAKRIRGDVLMFVGLMDTITPPSTVFAAFNKISSPKRIEVYPDFGHEGLPGSSDLMHEFLAGL